MNMILKALALPLLAVPVFYSCMVADGGPENDELNSSESKVMANYQVEGTVRDGSGTPVSGIRVIADYSTSVVYLADTLYTDKDGRYSKFLSIPRVDRFFLTFSDIDGSAGGGEFMSESVEVTPVRTEFSSTHFGGSYIVSYNVTLRKK